MARRDPFDLAGLVELRSQEPILCPLDGGIELREPREGVRPVVREHPVHGVDGGAMTTDAGPRHPGAMHGHPEREVGEERRHERVEGCDPIEVEHERRRERFPADLEAVFLARRGPEYVGFTGGLGTGVRPAERNRGVATALKVRAIARARERGERTMETATGNPAMVRVNEKLGFRHTSTEVRLVMRLGC